MSARVMKSGLAVDQRLADFIDTEAAPGSGIAPDRVTLGGNGNRAFAVQGDSPETQRYAQVDLWAGMQIPLADSSRQALTTLVTPSQAAVPSPAASQQGCPELLTDLSASGRGR